MTPEERATLASIGAQLVALADEPEPVDQAETVEVAAAVAAEVAEDVAMEVATAVEPEPVEDGIARTEAISEQIIEENAARTENEVEVIEAQADAAVAVIEAEAAANVAVVEALAEATDDAATDPAAVGDGEGADGSDLIEPDSPPSPTHPWFRPWGKR